MCAVKVTGLDKVIQELRQLGEDTNRILQEELKKICDGILADALARVPVDTGDLKASSYVNKTENGWAIGFTAKYAPYVEFGTGSFVQVPQGEEEFAMQFFVNGEGHGRPRPFLFPAFLSKRESIVTDLEKRLNDYLKSK